MVTYCQGSLFKLFMLLLLLEGASTLVVESRARPLLNESVAAAR